MTLTEENKQRLIWVRGLLKKNAPIVYKYFASYKLREKHEQITTDEQTTVSK